jgi:tetratricopeptide (TPR) repeat protein
LRSAQCGGGASCIDDVNSSQAIGLAIIVFFVSLGFLWGYVWTRLYFQRDLGGLVDRLHRDNEVAKLIFNAEQDVKEGNLDRALDTIGEALEISPFDGRALLTQARILKRKALTAQDSERAKLLNQALDCVNRSIAVMPGKAEPIYNKACYQALLGIDKNEVFANLKTAFRLNPAIRKIATEDPDFANLRQDPDFARFIEGLQA